MKVLFDQNIPRNLRPFLSPHEVKTAAELGWEELQNGELLRYAEAAGFDIFITGDQNLSYQQKLGTRNIAILELTTGRQFNRIYPESRRRSKSLERRLSLPMRPIAQKLYSLTTSVQQATYMGQVQVHAPP